MPTVVDDVIIEEGPHYTPLRNALFGSFNLSQSRIPYAQAVFSPIRCFQ